MNVGRETEAYAAYLNAPRDMFRDDTTERALFEQDTVRARAAMERAWLEAKPTEEPGPLCDISCQEPADEYGRCSKCGVQIEEPL